MNAPTINKIAIIRLSALGDIVHAIPAFHLLRTQFPHATICWFAEPPGAKLLENVAGIDQIFVTHFKTTGIKNKWHEVKRILAEQKEPFDLVLDFQGLLKSAVLAYLLKSHTIGFHKKNLKESVARFFYSAQAEECDESQHVIYKNLHLVQQVLPNPAPEYPQYPHYPLTLPPMAEVLKNFLHIHQLEPHRFVILNVGGGWESKLLSLQQNMAIIHSIKAKYPVVVLWGNEKEKASALQISQQTGIPITPFLDFSQLIYFIQQARLIVTADTLAMHLADMVKTPSVGIFGPTSPYRNGSLLKESIPIFEKLPCGFCYKKKCGTIECIKKINILKITESIECIYEKPS